MVAMLALTVLTGECKREGYVASIVDAAQAAVYEAREQAEEANKKRKRESDEGSDSAED
jgi:hypothetical protein